VWFSTACCPCGTKKTQNRPVTEVNTTACAACNTGSKNVFTPSVPHSHLGSVNPLCRTLCSCAAVVHWHVMFVLNVIAVILWILLSIYVLIYLFICILSSIIRPHRSYRSRRFYHGGFLRLTLHWVVGKFRYFQK